MTVNVSMESPCSGRTIIDIRQIGLKQKQHGQIFACCTHDGLCYCVIFVWHWKGHSFEGTNGGNLNVLGQLGADEDNLISEATAFNVDCTYGSNVKGDMNTHRYQLWKSKMAKSKITSAPKLKSLPPTHVHRAKHQVIIWKSATQSDPPDLDPIQYGWQEGEDGATLYPITFPPDVSPAPVTILQLIKCGWSTSRPCSTGRCGCVAAQMSCSMFCCCNPGSEL